MKTLIKSIFWLLIAGTISLVLLLTIGFASNISVHTIIAALASLVSLIIWVIYDLIKEKSIAEVVFKWTIFIGLVTIFFFLSDIADFLFTYLPQLLELHQK